MDTLLIIDDEKEVRDTIIRLIDWEELGIRLIGSAENGVEGLNMILDEYPDIVMTDIRMPGLSGIDLISKVCRINRDTHFIILTGFGEFEYAKQAMQFGVKHYLLKPCDETEIIKSIREVREDIKRDRDRAWNDRKEVQRAGTECASDSVRNDKQRVSDQVKNYVNLHLDDTSLSLKWIAENVLFMNVDYVSRRFAKETGKKFSSYLAEKRIRKAKELIIRYGDGITMNEIAERIGCGNNPQYFGQMFKKVEGISPRAYREKHRDNP